MTYRTSATERLRLRAGLLALLGLGLVPPVQAGDGPEGALEGLTPLDAAALDASHGRAGFQVDRIQINNNELTGIVTGNTAIGNVTGNNNVGDNAFMNSSGFMTTIQNTGNNVLIQNSTIINVAVEP